MSINAGSIYGKLELKADNYFNTLSRADTQMDSFKKKLNQSTKRVENIGKNLTTKVSIPLAGIATVATKVGMDFEAGMSKVQALSGATGDDLKRLEDKAREMGSSTKFSATEASEGLQYMALAGWDTNQMIEGLEPSLLLAGAAGMELGRATDIVTDTMSMFGMEAEEATKMTDMLAYAQANSNTDVEQLGEALKYAGANANAMGYDLADTTALLGTFADQGLKGSAAGTTLNRMFVDMKENVEGSSIAIGDHKVEVIDAQGNYRDMAAILTDVETATKDMTQAEKDAALSMVFGVQSIKGVNMVLEAGTDSLKGFEQGIRSSDGASKEMYDTMQNNLKGSIDNLKSALEEAGISLSQTLIPMVGKATEWLQKLVDKFNALDDETKENIVKWGLLVAAIGPVLVIGAKAVTLITTLGSALSGAATFMGAVGTAAAGGTVAIGGFAGAMATGLVAIAPWIAGLAAVGAVVYKVHQHLTDDAIPSVQLFTDEVSESTQKTVGAYMELDEQASLSLKQLAWSNTEVTETIKNDMVGKFTEMKDQVVSKYQEQKEEALAEVQDLFANTTALTEEEKQYLVRTTGEKYNDMISRTEEGNNRIKEILDRAASENRELYNMEALEIKDIQEGMKVDAVRVLSESEEEQQIILNRLRIESGKITALQAAEVVRNSLTQKEETIDNAKDEYAQRLAYAEQLKEDGTKESAELAEKIIADAHTQYYETVASAENMHKDVVEEAKAQAGEHIDEVEWTTGELLSNWEIMVQNTKEKYTEMKEAASEKIDEMKTEVTDKVAELGTAIKDKFNETVEAAKEWGSNLVKSIGQGIENGKDWVVGKARSLGNSISRGFKNVMQISSPSRLFIKYGENLPEGLAIGVRNKKPEAIREVESMANDLIREMNRLGDAITTALRNKYDEEERLQRNAINRKIEMERRASNTLIRLWNQRRDMKLGKIDDEMSEEEKALQNQIDVLNTETKVEEEEIRKQAYQKSVARKKEEIRQAAHNDEKTRLQEELSIIIANRDRELILEQRQMQIKALNEEMQRVRTQGQEKKDAIDLEYQQKIDDENRKLQSTINYYDEEMSATINHYAELREEEAIQAEARRLALAENNDELIDLLEEYNPKWQDAGQSFGQSLLNGLNSMKASIEAEVREILALVDKASGSVRTSRGSGNNYRGGYDDDYAREEGKRIRDKLEKNNYKGGYDDDYARKEGKRIRDKLKNMAHGTNFFSGGRTWVGELGPEIVELPKGSKIHSYEKSKEMIEEGKKIIQNITVNSPKPLSPSEVARENLKVSRQLASEWGV